MASRRTRGRPRIFATPETMEIRAQKYFFESESKNLPMTMEGLARMLGMSRYTLTDNGKREEFSPRIKGQKPESLKTW